jgi:hypothetical protein
MVFENKVPVLTPSFPFKLPIGVSPSKSDQLAYQFAYSKLSLNLVLLNLYCIMDLKPDIAAPWA